MPSLCLLKIINYNALFKNFVPYYSHHQINFKFESKHSEVERALIFVCFHICAGKETRVGNFRNELLLAILMHYISICCPNIHMLFQSVESK